MGIVKVIIHHLSFGSTETESNNPEIPRISWSERIRRFSPIKKQQNDNQHTKVSSIIRKVIPTYDRKAGGLGKLIHDILISELPHIEKLALSAMLGETWYQASQCKHNEIEIVVFAHVQQILAGYHEQPEKLAILRKILGIFSD